MTIESFRRASFVPPRGTLVRRGGVVKRTFDLPGSFGYPFRPFMRENIHPAYPMSKVHCACGATWETRSTGGDLHLDICSNCHPFFTGKQKLIDTQGRIDRFQKKYANAPKVPPKKAKAAAERKPAARSEKKTDKKPKKPKAEA